MPAGQQLPRVRGAVPMTGAGVVVYCLASLVAIILMGVAERIDNDALSLVAMVTIFGSLWGILDWAFGGAL